MLIRQDEAFYIEHGGRRHGYYNSRVRVGDVGKRDLSMKSLYSAETKAEGMFKESSVAINSPLRHYVVASIADYIVTNPLFVEWFGATHLLLVFSKRSRSRAWVGCIELADHNKHGLALFDIYHELAHNFTLRDTEPAHGERFTGAMLLIASLSPFAGHAHQLGECLQKEGLYPASQYFADNFYT